MREGDLDDIPPTQNNCMHQNEKHKNRIRVKKKKVNYNFV